MVTICRLCLQSIHFVCDASIWYQSSPVFCSYFSHRVAVSFVSSLSDYAFLQHLLCLKASNPACPPFWLLPFSALPSNFPSMLSIPYQKTTAGKNPTYVSPSRPIPMQDLTGNSHNQDYNQKYFDLTTNSERLPPRPRDRSTLEKTYARWCCGSILGVIAWIVVVLLLITVPIIVSALRNLVSPAQGTALNKVFRRKENQLAIQMQAVADMHW